MTIKTLEAWLLHKIPSGDSSLRVIFFSLEQGIISCHYQGGRAPKKQALLQPFSPLWLALDFRKDWHFVRQVETTASATALKGHSLFAGLYVNELLYYVLKPMDSHPELFKAYLQLMQDLRVIDERLAIEMLLRRFEWILLQACGYKLSFSHTANLQEPINPDRHYQFIAGEGFIAAEVGIAGTDILALAEGRLEQLGLLKSAKLIMRQAIDHLLGGRVLKSRSLYAK